jgi:AcrR family transcriptional regulator
MSTEPHPPRQRRLPRGETRRRVLDAAAKVFAERGYDATTLEDVAAAAGFSKGAVYSNFESKQDLFLALMRGHITTRMDAVRSATAVPGTFAQQTLRAGEELAKLMARQPDWQLLFIEFWTRAVRDPELRHELVEQRRPVRALIADYIEDAAARMGIELTVPSGELAVIVLALSNGIAIEHFADPDEVDLSLYATALSLMLQGAARPQPQ